MTRSGVAAVSLAVATTVLVAKWIAWRMTGSVTLLADGMESAVNVLAALVAWVALEIASRPPDKSHPFGHGKVEYFAAGLEGGLIAAASVAIIWKAATRLGTAEPLEAMGTGLAIAGIAGAVNLVLGLFLVRQGRALMSPTLAADGRHVLSDVATTVGALAGLGVAWATGFWWLDPIIAVVVALNVARVGILVVREAVDGLMDAGLHDDEQEQVERIVRARLGPALEAHGFRARRVAERVFVDFHLVVRGTTSVRQAHDVCDSIEAGLAEAFPEGTFSIHVEPEHEARGHLGDDAIRPDPDPDDPLP